MPTREPKDGAPDVQDMDPNKRRELLEAQAEAAGITKESARQAGWNVHDVADPYGPNPWAADEEVQWNRYEQGAMTDFISGVYNEAVVGLGEGLVNMMPTLAQAIGSDEDTAVGQLTQQLASDWIDTTSKWFDAQKMIYSDGAYEEVESFGDYFKTGKFASTLGEGVGFIAALTATRGLGSGAKFGKIASFMTGTTMMYGNIYDEAKAAGFEDKDAARMGLGLAGIVSLTEGAALEWIGKGATNWMPKEVVSSTFKKTLGQTGELGVKDFWKVNKLFSKNLAETLKTPTVLGALKSAPGQILKGGKNLAKGLPNKQRLAQGAMGAVRGGAIEFGQEFSQTYIENFGKELYDSLVTGTDNFNRVSFEGGLGNIANWDVGGAEMLGEAAYGGIIGAIIGGHMGGYQGLVSNTDTALGYIDKKVKKGDKKSLEKLYKTVDQSLQKGKISEEEHSNITKKLRDLQKYSEQTKDLDIEDHKANHQLYENIRTQEGAGVAMNEVFSKPDLPPVLEAAYAKNLVKTQKILDKQTEDAQWIIDNKKPLTKSKEKFMKMKNAYEELYQDVLDNKLNDEQFEERLSKVGFATELNEKAKSKVKEAEKASSEQEDGKAVSPVQEQEETLKADLDQIVKNEIKVENEIDAIKEEIEEGGSTPSLEQELAKKEAELEQLGKDNDVVSESLKKLKPTKNAVQKQEAGKVAKKEQAGTGKKVQPTSTKKEESKSKSKQKQVKPVKELQAELDEMRARKERGSKDSGLDAQIAEWEKAIEDQGGKVAPVKAKPKFKIIKGQGMVGHKLTYDYGGESKIREGTKNDIKTRFGVTEKAYKQAQDYADRLNKEIDKPEYDHYSVEDKHTLAKLWDDYQTDKATLEDESLEGLTSPEEVAATKKVLDDFIADKAKTDTDQETEDDVDLVDLGFEDDGTPSPVYQKKSEQEAEKVLEDKKGFIDSAKAYLSKTKVSAKLLKDSVVAAYNIVAEKGLTGTYTQEDTDTINEALKNVAKMVPQVAAAIAPIPGTATGLQILKQKSAFLKKLFTYSREALDAHLEQKERAGDEAVQDETIEDQIADVEARLESSKEERALLKESPDFIVIDNLPKITPTSARKETGVNTGTGQDISRNWTSKDGVTVERAAEQIWESKFSENNSLDVQEIRDIIIDAIQYQSATAWKNDHYTESLADLKVELANLKAQAKKQQGAPQSKTQEINEEANDITSRSEVNEKLNVEKTQTTEEELAKARAAKKKNKNKKRYQLAGFKTIRYDSRVAENPEFFNKVKKHFRKIFPGVSVQLVDKIVDEYGTPALGRLVAGGIDISKDSAMQSTLVHEYAEAYLSVMEETNPAFVKRGLDFIKGSDYHKQAQNLYKEYTPQEQLREALAQALTENTFDQLVDKFKDTTLAQKFLTWAKNLWNSIKSRFKKKKSADIITLMSNDLALSKSALTQTVPKTTPRYQLSGARNKNKSEADIYVENALNEAILNAKFKSIATKKVTDANDVMEYYYYDLYSEFLDEQNGESDNNFFKGETFGITEEDIANKTRSDNTQTFRDAFEIKYPKRKTFMDNAVKATMNEAPKQKIEENTTELKPTAKVTPGVRTIIGSILDDSTGSTVSKDLVWKTVLAANNKAFTMDGFMKNLANRARKNDAVAQRLLNLLTTLDDEYSIPIIRELSSMGQVKATTPMLDNDENGNFIIKRQVDNSDSRSGEIAADISNELVKSIKNNTLMDVAFIGADGHLPLKRLAVPVNSTKVKYTESGNGTIEQKIAGLENAIQKIFGLQNFSYADFEAHTGKGQPYLFGMLSEIYKAVKYDYVKGKGGGHILNKNALTVKEATKEFYQYFNELAVGEYGIQSLANSYANAMGNRETSSKLESNFSLTTKKLNNQKYADKLSKAPVYKNNTIVKMAKNGVKIEHILHGALKNRITDSILEYEKQSTIDNKMTGLTRYIQARKLKQKNRQYEQSVGVTADRSYQTFVTSPMHAVYTDGKVRAPFQAVLDGMTQRDQAVYDELQDDFSQLDAENKAIFLKAANDLTINTVVEEKGKLKVVENPNPFTDPKYKEDIDQLVEDIISLGLHDKIANLMRRKNDESSDKYVRDDKGNLSKTDMLDIREDLTDVAQEFFWNDYVNRKSIEDLYAGPFERHLIKTKFRDGKQVKESKSVEEAIKRYGLANSVGVRNELDKPVRLIVLDLNSDSFSINGTKLMERLSYLGGSLDKVGSSIKDSIYEVQHGKGGRVISGKMSTFGMMTNYDKDGNEIGNNWDQMTPPNNSTITSTQSMAEAVVALEKHLEEMGLSDYVKIVDTDVTKNELQEGATVMSGDQFVENIQKGDFKSITDSFPEVELNNYRTIFNLHKDLSTVPLVEQEVVMTTQMVAIASNLDGETELADIDNQIVSLLKEQFGDTARGLSQTRTFINNAVAQADETGATWQKELLVMMQAHNNHYDAKLAFFKLAKNDYKNEETYLKKLVEIADDLPLKDPRKAMYDGFISDMESGKSFNQVKKSLEGYKHRLNSLDHPNLKDMMGNAAASRINKAGVRLALPGNYLRVIPDYNKDLEFHKGERVYETDENGEFVLDKKGKKKLIDFIATDVSDIAIPWSMVANSRKEAQDLLEAKNATGEGLRVVAVRVPTGSNTMIFAAKVKYFIDGNSNNVATPEGFIDVSDSDHDADKLFVYRQEMDNEGSVLEDSPKSQMFESLYGRFSNPEFIKQTMLESVSVQELKERQQNITKTIQNVETSLRTLAGTANIANAMKDGLTGVGIFAVTVKSLSVMHQSGVKLKEPITIDLGPLGTKVLENIDIKALEDAALYLQAALDNAKENVLSYGGVTKDNMGTVSAMLIAGMRVEEITSMLNNTDVKKYLGDVNADQSVSSIKERQNKTQLRQQKRRSNTDDYIKNSSPSLNPIDQASVDTALKADQYKEELVSTRLSEGIYHRLDKYAKKGKARYFKIRETAEGKTVIAVSQEEASDAIDFVNQDSGASKVLMSYFTLEDIGNEISKVTPIIQLDGGIPNTGVKARTIQAKIETLRNLEDYKYFDFEAIRDRKKYGWLAGMNKTMIDTMQLHFLTEQETVYEVSESLFKSLANRRNITKDSIHRMVSEVIQTMVAQEKLSAPTKAYNQAQLDSFVDSVAKRIKQINSLTEEVQQEITPKTKQRVEQKLEELGVEGFLNAPDNKVSPTMKEAYKVMYEQDDAVDFFNQTVVYEGQDVKLGDYLKGNLFFKSLSVDNIRDKDKVTKNKAFDILSDLEKKNIKDGFIELLEVAPDFAREILDYQLLHNGLNQKMGSFAEIFPQQVHMKYIEDISQRTFHAKAELKKDDSTKEEFQEEEELEKDSESIYEKVGTAKNQQKAFEINAALRMIDSLPTAKVGDTDLKGTYFNVDGELYIYETKEIDSTGKLVDSKTAQLTPAAKHGSFMTNGEYYKFGRLRDYANLFLDKKVTEEEYEELKKCIAKGGKF